jgi:cell division protein FtsQ
VSGVQLRDRPGVVAAGWALPIDPRMAARGLAVRRDQHRRRRRWLITALLLVTVLVGAGLAARSPLLAVHQVVVRGARRTDATQVRAAARLSRHPPMLDVDLRAIGARVEALPWVARATIRREWPGTVTIALSERTPLAQVAESAGQTAVVDATGRVLAVAAGGDVAAVLGAGPPPLPALQGLAPGGPAGSSLGPPARASLQIVVALQNLLPGPGPGGYVLSAVTVGGDGTVTASLAPGVTSVVFGSPDQLDAKVLALQSVLAHFPPGTVATIDLRVPDTPVLTDGQKSSRFSTTQRG